MPYLPPKRGSGPGSKVIGQFPGRMLAATAYSLKDRVGTAPSFSTLYYGDMNFFVLYNRAAGLSRFFSARASYPSFKSRSRSSAASSSTESARASAPFSSSISRGFIPQVTPMV